MSRLPARSVRLFECHRHSLTPFAKSDICLFGREDEVRDKIITNLTVTLAKELFDHIDVYESEGKGKNKTQRIVIHYRFVGVIENPVKEKNIVLEARQGVAVENLTA